jgi:hypothetical protein
MEMCLEKVYLDRQVLGQKIFADVLMKNQAILTLMIDKQEILKVSPDRLSPRGCEFVCNEEQATLFRDEGSSSNQGRYVNFQVRLGLFPHSGPTPQYVSALGQITAVRRSAQDCHRVILQFDDISADGYRLIAEHLSDSVVSLINPEQSQSA